MLTKIYDALGLNEHTNWITKLKQYDSNFFLLNKTPFDIIKHGKPVKHTSI